MTGAQLASAEITLLDGGMGGEISKRLPAAATGLWSAEALVHAPEIVSTLHAEYIEAGADIITTNTYSTVPHYLEKFGLDAQYEALTALAGELAREVADNTPRAVSVAGSVPPLNESYRDDLVPVRTQAEPIYKAFVAALAPYVDLFVCETMSSATEAHTACVQALEAGAGKPVMVAWTLDERPGRGLRSGETIEDAYKTLSSLPIDGYLFNCSTPEAIQVGLRTLSELTDKPIGGYPNRTREVPPGWTLDNRLDIVRRSDLTTDYFVAQCREFVRAGATMVGGCCGIAPQDIAALAQEFA